MSRGGFRFFKPPTGRRGAPVMKRTNWRRSAVDMEVMMENRKWMARLFGV